MKKIMFNDKYGLTTAVLEGRKTMTRRLYSPTKPLPFLLNEGPTAIAQPYKDIEGLENMKDEAGYNNKMFVKASLMPHQLMMKNVSYQKLRDISDEDCLREGIIVGFIDGMDVYYSHPGQRPFNTPREAFADLIDKVCGKDTWDYNPYVIVYTFELTKQIIFKSCLYATQIVSNI